MAQPRVSEPVIPSPITTPPNQPNTPLLVIDVQKNAVEKQHGDSFGDTTLDTVLALVGDARTTVDQAVWGAPAHLVETGEQY